MFEATKREAGELLTFFRLLADGRVEWGDAQGNRDEQITPWPVAMVQRMEHNGPRRYLIEPTEVCMVYGEPSRTGDFVPDETRERVRVPRQDFAEAADLLLQLLKSASGVEMVELPDGLEGFLNALDIYDLEAKTEDRTDLSVAFWSVDAPLTGFCVRCRLSPMNPLLDGGRTANLKLEQTGVKFAVPTVNKVNALPESPTEVTDRMLMIERLGGVLKFADVADRVFRANLQMIDLHFPRMLAEMVRTMHLEGLTRVSDLTEYITQSNPLKIKDELIGKHGYYEHKMKQFLLALALGMRPAKIYRGTDSAIEGYLMTLTDGRILGYHVWRKAVMADFLFRHTRLEKGSLEKDKYGFLERENGTWYFKLNAKIGWMKRLPAPTKGADR